jgi:DNA-binding NarL/FixJ family response regulator
MVNGASPDERGCAFVLFSKQANQLTPALRTELTRVAVHLATAHRLNHRLQEGSAAADAVLCPDGKLEHAEAAARSPRAQQELRGAAEAIAWARSRSGRAQPDKALELWKGLVAGRWSLVDSFERDGKRYLLARQNAPVAQRLSSREQQVVALARLGRSNKVIAYELGIADPTVRVLIARAAKKLGVTSREELLGCTDSERNLPARSDGDNAT